jgi:hypothetical protein
MHRPIFYQFLRLEAISSLKFLQFSLLKLPFLHATINFMADDDDQLNKTAPVPPIINDADSEFEAEGGGEPVDIDEEMEKVGLPGGVHEVDIAKEIDKAEDPMGGKIPKQDD